MIDSDNQLLYWANDAHNRIFSSNLDGSEVLEIQHGADSVRDLFIGSGPLVAADFSITLDPESDSFTAVDGTISSGDAIGWRRLGTQDAVNSGDADFLDPFALTGYSGESYMAAVLTVDGSHTNGQEANPTPDDPTLRMSFDVSADQEGFWDLDMLRESGTAFDRLTLTFAGVPESSMLGIFLLAVSCGVGGRRRRSKA